jgi:CelD/BcsL family acetyltransferase involved in cellulose biosynthesis
MLTPRLLHIKSISELRQVSDTWDDLWAHSDVANPTARAELLAQWLEQFAPGQRFQAVAVVSEGSFLAALPLVEKTVRGALCVGHVPSNAWAHGGGLLIRKGIDRSPVVDMLVEALRDLPWRILWFERIPIQSRGYQVFMEALSHSRAAWYSCPQYDVAIAHTDQDWDAFVSNLKPSLRTNLRKWQKRMDQRGGGEVRNYSLESPKERERLLRAAFELEDNSWKGQEGSSVIRRGLLPYFLRQAETLAGLGHFAFFGLEVQGKMIAFQYGYAAKGVMHDCKISFDQDYRSLGPGHLLYFHVLRHCFRDSSVQFRNNLGDARDSAQDWQFPTYPVGQLIIAPRSFYGRLVVHFRAHWWPRLRQFVRRARK